MKKGITRLGSILALILIMPALGVAAEIDQSVLDMAAGILAIPTATPSPALDLAMIDEMLDAMDIPLEGPDTDAPVPETERMIPVPEEPVVPDNPMPEARYVGIAQQNIAIRSEMSRESDSLGNYAVGEQVYIVGYEPDWLYVVKGDKTSWVAGYVLRHTVSEISTYKVGELPYGSTPAKYSAILAEDTLLRVEPNEDSKMFLKLTKGTKIAILEIEDGWAKVIYSRQYGYFYLDAVEELTPVYDTASAQSGDAIAAFISFYKQDTDQMNLNRMINIAKACEYISIPLEPGQEFSFNGIAGPYRQTRGYLEGMSYFEGQAVPSTGGGTCQVSSTLYNVLLPLDEGIRIVYRRAHGPSGASYLPHGVDAAVGNETLDLVFRNDYSFPVRIEASSHDGVLYIAMLKA